VVTSLLHRAFTISDAESLDSEKKHLTTALMKNGYDRRMVLKRAIKVKKMHSRPSEERQATEEGELTKPAARLTIPYIGGVSECIARILRKHDVVTRFNCVTKIQNIVPGPKDHIPQELCEGVYTVPCSCGKSYVGETCRGMATRMKEHVRAANKKQLHLSAIAEHAWSEAGHKIDFDKAKIVAKERRYYPRQIREAIEIHKTQNFNRDNGYPISNVWKRVLTNQRAGGGRPVLYKAAKNHNFSPST
jgi:predicted GIY-YIG superfamily endonuclease